jgi:hypothetical protein
MRREKERERERESERGDKKKTGRWRAARVRSINRATEKRREGAVVKDASR